MERSACLCDSHVTNELPLPQAMIYQPAGSAPNCHEIYHILSLHSSPLHGYKLGTNSRRMVT